MKYYYTILTFLLITLQPIVKIQAQSSDVYRVVKSSNGQSFLLNTIGGSTINTDVYFRIGTIYEFDSLSGISMILSKIINNHIAAELRSGGRQVKYYGTVEPEMISFHFESSLADLDYVLNLAKDKITLPAFSESDVEEAKSAIRAEIDSMKNTESYKKDINVLKKIWGNDYKKLNPYGDQKTYLRLKADDLMAFHKRYFLPFNNTVSILGSYSDKDVLDKLQLIFKDFKSREFNPELINRVMEFKPVINTVQLISNNPDRNIATITYQNPGSRQDRTASYCAFILTQMINDKDGRIQKTMKSAGLKNLKAIYSCNNFYGTFVLSAQPTDDNFFDAITHMGQLFSDITQKDYFKEGDIEKAKRNITIEYNDLKSNNMKGFMALVTRYRFGNDENYFSGFIDSINGVNIDHMRRYATDYYTDHSGVRSLATTDDALKNASADQQYFVLDESIADSKFTYELNKTDIETDEAKQNLKRVIQWLRINTDMHVQINGFADEGEFKKAYNDTVLRFIDSTATFHKAMPDVTKKGYLRIEFMRAMKIAKALYEAGISEDRISGTSMVFTSDSKEGAAANRKCTLTLDKIKPRLSLYEYHFGKKKDEKQD